jgi:hypothetical protein
MTVLVRIVVPPKSVLRLPLESSHNQGQKGDGQKWDVYGQKGQKGNGTSMILCFYRQDAKKIKKSIKS